MRALGRSGGELVVVGGVGGVLAAMRVGPGAVAVAPRSDLA